ncbi:MAG: multidrug transporter [Chloroflexota bacterium]|nr:multidrug transporter [Chloroflexota bacterium]
MTRKVILRDRQRIFPFNEPARDLRVLNKKLYVYQSDVLDEVLSPGYVTEVREVDSLAELDSKRIETIAFRDNLFFDRPFLSEFIERARASGEACQVALSADDPAIAEHALPLQRGIRRDADVLVADLWYFPRGVESNSRPLVMDTDSHEMGYYHVPTHMSNAMGDLVYQVPTKAFCSIEHWVHTITANVIFGVYAEGARLDRKVENSLGKNVRMLWRAILERKQVLGCSETVHIGRNCSIDPSVVIRGPSYIGDNVSIGPGAVVDVSYIGDNVDIGTGGQVMLSVVSDRSFLPFRAALFMSVMMAGSMVAQNTCLQFCSIGRNTFVGAGNTFTDFNLVPGKAIRAMDRGEFRETGMPVLGGCVGHNCFIGSGMVVYPARAIESDVVLLASDRRRVIDRTVYYEDSDHFSVKGVADSHRRWYPR